MYRAFVTRESERVEESFALPSCQVHMRGNVNFISEQSKVNVCTYILRRGYCVIKASRISSWQPVLQGAATLCKTWHAHHHDNSSLIKVSTVVVHLKPLAEQAAGERTVRALSMTHMMDVVSYRRQSRFSAGEYKTLYTAAFNK